jgi:hypothetical protein
MKRRIVSAKTNLIRSTGTLEENNCGTYPFLSIKYYSQYQTVEVSSSHLKVFVAIYQPK